MAEISRKNFPDGWIPSDNAIGGRKTGLLRMDNLFLDDNGIVKLVPGLRRLNSTPLEGTVHSIYSQNFDNQKIRFVGLSNGDVKAAVEDFSSSANIITGGNAEIASFATLFGWVFAASGKKVVRYNIATVEPVGLHKPDSPAITNNVGPVSRVVEDYSSAEVTTGTLISKGTQIDLTTDVNLGAVVVTPTESNTMILSSGGKGRDGDRIQLPFTAADSTKIVRVRLEFRVSETDYYFYQWEQGVDKSPLNEGKDVTSVLSALRSEFQRAGNESSGDWSEITSVRLSVVTTEETNISFQRVSIFGGNAGTLDGPYQYKVQSVARAQTNGITQYVAKSPASDATEVIYTHNNTVNVYLPDNPPEDYFIDEWWIFRKSADINPDINPLTEKRRLDTWYRVGVVPFGTGEYEDKTSDEEALEEGEQLDFEIASIADISSEIASMVASGTRIWYLTNSEIIPSIAESPDSYRPFQVLKTSGSNAEKNLWITKGEDGTIYVGTTEDVYRISGDFVTLADGTLSATIKGLGLGDGFQPISRSFTTARGSIFYISANGWIQVSNGSAELLVGDLDFLFRKTSRHDFPYVSIIPNGLALYGVCVRRNQLWCANVMSDGSRRVFVYDFERKYWHVRNIDPVSLYCEDDGTILGGFGGGSGNYLNELDTGTDLSGINGQNIHLRTVFDDFDMPNQRKDVFTVRLWAKSDKTVTVELAIEGFGFLQVGSKNFGANGDELFIEVPSKLGTEKSWAIQIKGSDLSLFEYYGHQIEYEARPVQQNYLRIPPTNLGTISRKAFTSYALVLDSLGANFTITPLIDNIPQDPIVFNAADKLTSIYYFTEYTIGTDIGAIVKTVDPNHVFEFYGINPEETVSEKLPVPTKFLRIPATDYGEPNRKRHSSYKFAIHTRGGTVRFVPRIDGIDQSPFEFSTSEKRIVPVYFVQDTIGVDIGGDLISLSDTPFEFYGTIKPQNLEIFPPLLKEFRSPETNFGIASKKRVRTLPMRINTRGAEVTFFPIVDGQVLSSSTLISNYPKTLAHYFSTDVFGTDFAGEFVSSEPFEFHGFEKPEEVEILPVGKKFDQIGPFQMDRIGKLLSFRVRAIFYDPVIPVKVYIEDDLVYTHEMDVQIAVDKVHEIMQFPKTISGTTLRFELGPTTEAFHRYTAQIKIKTSGMETSNKWVTLK